MKYRYYICDVFTETRFGGNPLAVLPKADRRSDHQMQPIQHEFNFSDDAFLISLNPDDILTDTHHPQVFSAGLPFVITELKDRTALERARINMSGFDALADMDIKPLMHLYVRVSDGFDIRARMFAPLSGVPEDPATARASCALAGLLAHYKKEPSGSFNWRIAQGVEMARPSILLARAEKADGTVQATWVGGSCVMVSEGTIYLD